MSHAHDLVFQSGSTAKMVIVIGTTATSGHNHNMIAYAERDQKSRKNTTNKTTTTKKRSRIMLRARVGRWFAFRPGHTKDNHKK